MPPPQLTPDPSRPADEPAPGSTRRPAARYGVAVVAAALAVLLTELLSPVVPQLTWLLVLGAVSVAAWFGGFGPGVLATVVGAAGVMYLRIPPEGSFAVDRPADALWLLSYVLVALVVSAVTAALHRERDRASASAGAYRALAERLQRHADALEGEVAARREVEAALRRQADLLEQSYDAILAWEPGGGARGITFWSRGAVALYGYTAEEALGRSPYELLRTTPVDDGDAPPVRTMADVEAALARDGRWEGVLEHVARDGRRIVTESRHVLVRDPGGGRPVVLETSRDVMARRQAEAALAASEARLAAIIESAMDAIVTTDADRRIVLFNHAAEAMFGVAASDAIGTLVDRFIPGALRGRHAEHMRRFGETGVTTRSMHRIPGALPALRGDGTEFPVEATISHVRGPAGERLYTVVLRDVTARVAAERALAASEARFRSLVETAPQLTWSLRADGTVEFFNARWYEYTGLDPATAATGWLDAVHPDDRAGLLAARERALAAEEAYELEVRLRRRDGAFRWFLARIAPLRDDAGVVVAWHGVAMDIDDRRRREEADRVLAEAGRIFAASFDHEERLRLAARVALPTLADLCIVDLLDDDGRLRRVAAAHADAARETALLPGDGRTGGRADEVPPAIRAALDAGKVLVTNDVTEAWLEAATPTPERRDELRALAPVAVLAAPLVARGRPLGVLVLAHARPEAGGSGRHYDAADVALAEEFARRAAIAVDNSRLFVAEREARELAEATSEQLEEQAIELEQHAEQAQTLAAELEVTADELRAAVAVAESASRAKSDFLATMSHEIRTPLNAILGYTELLELGLAGALSDRQRDYVARVRTSGQHLLTLINEMLDLAKVEAGRMLVTRRRGRLARAVDDAVEMVRAQAAARQLAIACDCAGDLAYMGDEDRVRQILANLLSNAVKFTGPGGRVEVACEAAAERPDAAGARPGPWVAVRVTDTGAGIPADQLETIFEPFVQLDAGYTRAHGGTGLGLAISRRLARLMGGEVTVASRPGEGSVFTLWLPAPAEPGALRTPVPAPVPAPEEPRLALVGELLGAGVVAEIVRTVSDRLRADPVTAVARDASDALLEDHWAAILADLAQRLVILGEAGDEARPLLRDGEEIAHLIATRHGAQRRRLGWTEEALEREYEVVAAEVETAVRRGAALSPGAPVDPALTFLRRALDEAREISRRGFRAARAAGG